VLFLLLKIGHDTYALDARQIAHVLSLVHVAPLANAPRGLAGVFNYRGTLVPAVDLSAMRSTAPARPQFSTRVVLINYPHGTSTRLVGLIAEQATDVIRRAPSEFVAPGLAATSAARGSVMDGRYGVVQWIDAPALLTPEVRNNLFTAATPS
jgi:chemotaxis-related protein WspB